LQEDHTAEEMANGKVGSPNQYRRYFKRPVTLSEQPIRGDREIEVERFKDNPR
jgi:hypothetical protein